MAYSYTESKLTKFRESIQVGFDIVGNPIFTELDHTGNFAAFSPKHLFNLWISKSFYSGFGIGGGVRYVDNQLIDEDNLFRMDDYIIFNALVFYELSRWKLSLNIKNIANAEYALRGFGNSSIIPANPRTFHGSIEFIL